MLGDSLHSSCLPGVLFVVFSSFRGLVFVIFAPSWRFEDECSLTLLRVSTCFQRLGNWSGLLVKSASIPSV